MHTERPPGITVWVAPFALGILGTYVLLGALAIGELNGARWGLWLVLGAVACFAVAGVLAAGPAKRVFRGD